MTSPLRVEIAPDPIRLSLQLSGSVIANHKIELPVRSFCWYPDIWKIEYRSIRTPICDCSSWSRLSVCWDLLDAPALMPGREQDSTLRLSERWIRIPMRMQTRTLWQRIEIGTRCDDRTSKWRLSKNASQEHIPRKSQNFDRPWPFWSAHLISGSSKLI